MWPITSRGRAAGRGTSGAEGRCAAGRRGRLLAAGRISPGTRSPGGTPPHVQRRQPDLLVPGPVATAATIPSLVARESPRSREHLGRPCMAPAAHLCGAELHWRPHPRRRAAPRPPGVRCRGWASLPAPGSQAWCWQSQAARSTTPKQELRSRRRASACSCACALERDTYAF